MDLREISIIAHRGASALVEHENTIEAFKKAIDIGSPAMEFDIRMTKDNIMISYHDESIEEKSIRELTYAEVQLIANEKGFSVPKVEEILELSKDKIFLDIELKEAGYEKEAAELIKRHLDYDQYVIKSFWDVVIKKIKLIDNKIKTGLLLGLNNPKRRITTRLSELFPELRIIKAKPDFISPNYKLLKYGFIHRMKLYGLPVFVWTVNDEKLMGELLTKGIDAIITDRPDIGLQLCDPN